jgi:hypothetical protein
LFFLATAAILATSQQTWASEEAKTPISKSRRILYNLDGDSCTFTKKGSKGPAPITAEDLKVIVEEIAYPGSQVDTLLVCINAQCTYYPSKVGDLRGSLDSPSQREQWPPSERQRFTNIEAMFAQGVDPYALLLAEAKKRGLESLLTYRMNDAHGFSFLHCKLWLDHPEYRLGAALDFGQEAVRDYTFRIIEEAVQRYDCDGIELDFQRFPTFFRDEVNQEQRIAMIDALVQRVRGMLDEEGKKRKKHLVLASRVPSIYEKSREIGCDPVVWTKNGWIDFLTVSEFLFVRYDLPIAPWKKMISTIPIYGGIEPQHGEWQTMPGPRLGYLSPDEYRRAARHLWANGTDGIYLFNFFCPREEGDKAFEPPFEILKELGDPKALEGT